MRYGFKDVVIDSRTGLNPRKNFVLGSGKNNYITIKDIYNGQINITDKTDKVDDDAIQIIKKRSRIKVGDILFVSIGRIGETAIVTAKDDTWDVNESVFVFTINSEIITPEYFCILFQSDAVQKYLTGNSSGSTFKSIKMNQLEKMVFDLPPLSIQKEITAKLSKAKAICNLRLSELAQLDDLIKARFVEMFGAPDYNEKGWKMRTFRDICTVRQGLQIPVSKRLAEFEEGCYEYITVQYLNGGKAREYIKNPKETVICTKDDILMTRTGNTGMVITGVNGVFHNNFFLVDFDRDKYEKDFLVQYLKLDVIQADIIRRAGTSTIPDLNHGEFYKIPVFEPPKVLQKDFSLIIEQVDRSKLATQKALDEAQTLFDSLMQKYFG